MKKILLSFVLISMISGLQVIANDMISPADINSLQGFFGLHSHEMNTIEREWFKREELNPDKGVQEQKEEKLKELEREGINLEHPVTDCREQLK